MNTLSPTSGTSAAGEFVGDCVRRGASLPKKGDRPGELGTRWLNGED